MARTAACRSAEQLLRQHLPQLNRTRRRGLARWLAGSLLADSANKPSVIQALCALGEAAASSLDQQWDSWMHFPAQQTLDPSDAPQSLCSPLACGAALLGWIYQLWTGGPLVLGIDASLRRDELVLLRISVLYRGTALPVAWVVVPANRKGAWMPHLERMLRWLAPAVPSSQSVFVLADQGLWSPHLWAAIRNAGWHPLMRARRDTTFAPTGQQRQRVVGGLVSKAGQSWIGSGVAFKHRPKRVEATLAAVWEQDQAEPWVLLSDVPAEQVDPAWYALRMWDEHGFRDSKSMGFEWQRSQVKSCDVAAWQYLVVAVATLWSAAAGTRLEDAELLGQAAGRLRSPCSEMPVRRARRSGTATRALGLVRQGRQQLRRTLSYGRVWRRLWLRPEPLPKTRPQITVHVHSPS